MELRDISSNIGLAVELSVPPAARAVLEMWAARGCVFRVDPYYPSEEYESGPVRIDAELADNVDGVFEQE